MSDDIGRELPPDLFDALWNEDVTVERGRAVLIVTADENDWPHPALLSFREVGARAPNTIRVVTYNGSTTTRNMRENGRITLAFVDERFTYYVKGTAKEIPRHLAGASEYFATMDVRITQILKDFTGADEEGAYITSGITFHNPWPAGGRPAQVP
ncbi:MAG: pyridoxamine 5'-phosphate oxidase family protein [Chloroflexi bacterium]|nr:pyridoxamine 5'-phosphate oxidase family protein [Chloroflexota bacterium]